MVRTIYILCRKEILTEFRNTYSISSVLLYLFATIFIIYSSFINVPASTWNTLFWVVFLFISVNALLRSFDHENSARALYYYQIAHPVAIYAAKLIYNSIMLMLLGLISLALFSFISGSPVRDYRLFLVTLGLAALGFSAVFTFIASIGAKSGNSHVLTAILGFPCIIPIMLELIKLSANALGLINDTSYMTDVIILCAIIVAITALTLILYPFVWRE